MEKTKFYELNSNGTKWIPSTLNATNIRWHWITLYNDDLTKKGIGMYPKKASLKSLKHEQL